MSYIFKGYLDPTSEGVSAFLADSVIQWSQVVEILDKIEKSVVGPFALGDQISLADLHLTVWLARVFNSAIRLEPSLESNQVAALEQCLKHPFLAASPVSADPTKLTVGLKVRTEYYLSPPSFQLEGTYRSNFNSICFALAPPRRANIGRRSRPDLPLLRCTSRGCTRRRSFSRMSQKPLVQLKKRGNEDTEISLCHPITFIIASRQ